MALTWTAAWPMWTAVKHNKRKHLRRQDSGIFHEVHVYRDAVAGGAAEDFCISHRCDAQKNVGPLIWRMFIGCLRCAPDYLCTSCRDSRSRLRALKPAKVSSSLQESLLPKNIHTTFSLPLHLIVAAREQFKITEMNRLKSLGVQIDCFGTK